MNKTILASAALLLLVAGVLTIVTGAVRYRRSQAESLANPVDGATVAAAAGADEDWLTQYTLTRQSGEAFRSQDLDGKVAVTSFFFANCPTVCRLQNLKIKELQDEFGGQGVKFVSITCDPKNDTPERLAEYAKTIGADPQQWVFLTGDLTYVRRIGAEMYTVPVGEGTHTERLIVTDRTGTVRGRYHWNNPVEFEEVKKLLNKLLLEKTSSASDADS